MAQIDFVDVFQAKAYQPNDGEKRENNLFNHIADSALKACYGASEGALAVVGLLSGTEETNRKALGLPSLDLTGFEQEAPYRSQGTLRDIFHDIKHVFVKDETLNAKLRRHVEGKLAPEERKTFDQENKALAEHERKVISWASTLMVPPPPYPAMPDTPMHREISRRVEKLSEQISEQVRGEMSQTDIRRLDNQLKDYQHKYREATTIRNPMGTGEGFKLFNMPTPGNAIKDYFDRVAEATDRYLQKAGKE